MTRVTKAHLQADNDRLAATVSWFHKRHLHYEHINDDDCGICEVVENGPTI